MFTAADIHIFILTHNRSALLQQALQSIQAQTLSGSPVTVLDNNSGDDTEETVRRWADKNVRYVKTVTPHCTANLIKAQELMDREFALILHDDDLLHPYFVQIAVDALNRYPQTALIPAQAQCFNGKGIPAEFQNAQKPQAVFHRLTSPRQAAGEAWLPGGFIWSGSVARSSAYKKLDISALHRQYGKILDGIILNQLSKDGNTLHPATTTVFYRLHEGQDSKQNATGVRLEQLWAWITYFHDLLAQSPDRAERRIYMLYSYKIIRGIYAFLSEDEKKRYPWKTVFVPELLKKRFLTRGMVFYAQRHKSRWGRIITLPMKVWYDRHFYKNTLVRLP